MLIRSQNRKTLVNLSNISNLYISNCDIYVEYAGATENFERIAGYSTEEKAIKVLDMIQNRYITPIYINEIAEHEHDVYRNFVFQMPQDSEVVE